MLTKIKVDGFRSLNDFTFEPKQGLNVLVGANGAGKTNIIDFLKFVSLIRQKDLNEAVKALGGADSIFSRFYEKKDIITYEIIGTKDDKNYLERGEIQLNDLGIKFRELAIWHNNIPKFMGKHILNYPESLKNTIFNDEIPINIFRENSISLNFENPYNFTPSIIKQFDAIGSEPTITSQGEGLHTYLYKLQTQDSNTLSLVQSYFSYLRDDILEFKTEKDEVRNCFVTYATFKGNIRIPITHLSDGTVKWLAMVAACMSSKDAFVMDEPENYIHPELQRIFIDMLRERMEQTGGIAIISTHSETILNNVTAEEVVMVKNTNGKTTANRHEKIEAINKLISEEGFGFGHFYARGAFK